MHCADKDLTLFLRGMSGACDMMMTGPVELVVVDGLVEKPGRRCD